METYFEQVMSSELPISVWLVAALWLVIFISSTSLAARANKLVGRQSHITVPENAQPKLTLPRLAIQVLVASVMFFLAHVLGGAWEAFFAGGWCIAAAVVFAMNLRNHLSLSRLSQNGMATGQVVLAAKYSLADLAYGLAANALLFLAVAILLAQSSAFGAAWFLGASSLGYWRKARAAPAA